MRRVSAGRRRHLVTLFALGAAIPDGDGGFTQPVTALSPPSAQAAIEPATANDLERVMSGTVVSEATHLVSMPYRSDVSTNTVILFNGRRFDVVGVANPEERNIELIVACKEVLNMPPVIAHSNWMQTDWIS